MELLHIKVAGKGIRGLSDMFNKDTLREMLLYVGVSGFVMKETCKAEAFQASVDRDVRNLSNLLVDIIGNDDAHEIRSRADAVFCGEDGSMGLKNGKRYWVSSRVNSRHIVLSVWSQNGKCCDVPYSSVEKVLENWKF